MIRHQAPMPRHLLLLFLVLAASGNAMAGVFVSLQSAAGDGRFRTQTGTVPGQHYSVYSRADVNNQTTIAYSQGAATEGHLQARGGIRYAYNNTNATTSADVSFADAFTIRKGALPVSQNEISRHGRLMLQFYFHGTLRGNSIQINFDEYWLGGFASASMFVFTNGGVGGLATGQLGNVWSSAKEKAFDDRTDFGYAFTVPTLSEVDPVTGLTTGRYEYSGQMSYDLAVFHGHWEANFFDTGKLTGIVFEDGNTPEELGYTLEFDSGITSPNVASGTVPEPATAVLFAALSVCVLGTRRPKKRLP